MSGNDHNGKHFETGRMVDTTVAGLGEDSSPPSEPLVLYRVLLGGSSDAGNVMRAAKSGPTPGAVALSY